MATHSCILVWEISWTEKPSGLHAIGLQRIEHDWVTEHKGTINYIFIKKLIANLFCWWDFPILTGGDFSIQHSEDLFIEKEK